MSADTEKVAACKEVVARMVDEEFRIEREDCHIINFETGDTRFSPAARVYLRSPKGRWAKTDLLLMAHDETPTIGDVLRSFADLLDAEEAR